MMQYKGYVGNVEFDDEANIFLWRSQLTYVM